MTTELQTKPAVVLSAVQLDALCRADFVKYMKAEQEHREPWFRMSIKAHRQGMQYGFDHPGVQLKWLDYKAGWLTGRTSNIDHTAKPT